jgi:hypothetical protein
MPNHSLGAGVFMSVALALGASACSDVPSDPGNETSGTGTIMLPLTAQSGDTTYRLAQALFTIKGNGLSRVIQPPADTPVHQETLPTGGYEIRLEKGWQLERKGPADTAFVPVPAQLTTQNPLKFKVQTSTVVDVVFTFSTNGGAVDFGRGRANVRIDVQDCRGFDTLAASIATSVVDCLGTIGPTAFLLDDEGFLVRNFERCQDPETEQELLETIDAFVGLQHPRELPASVAGRFAFSKDCISGRWAAWKASFDESGIFECPSWFKEQEINTPTPELYKEYTAQLPDLPFTERNGERPPVVGQLKINNLYSVRFPNGTPDQQCGSPGDCAARCAQGFPGFVIRQDGENVLTDPPPWQRATVYSSTDPFDPPYYHPMSLSGELPGETVGHINRQLSGDACSFWDGEFHVETKLKENCATMPDGTKSCIGLCAP